MISTSIITITIDLTGKYGNIDLKKGPFKVPYHLKNLCKTNYPRLFTIVSNYSVLQKIECYFLFHFKISQIKPFKPFLKNYIKKKFATLRFKK